MPEPVSDISTNNDSSDLSGRSWWFALRKFLFRVVEPSSDSELRKVIEDYIDDPGQEPVDGDAASTQERTLLSNILDLRDITVVDVMIPRADIIAVDEEIDQEALLNLLMHHQVSRYPVYRGTLDEVLGTLHIKDILAALARGQHVNVPELIRDVPIVSPSMSVLNLILEMRNTKRHMAMVVDEFGGIDGLVTVGDVIESIVGELDDEHDTVENQPQIIERPDGGIFATARLEIEDFENHFGEILTAQEREENDTLGGLIYSIVGRVPARGEVITHQSGAVFEIIEADPRRIHKVKVTAASVLSDAKDPQEASV
jgi:magnesium and cobalt transporter